MQNFQFIKDKQTIKDDAQNTKKMLNKNTKCIFAGPTMSVIIINSPIMGRSSCTEWLDEACETPLVSVLNVMLLLLLLMVSVLLVMELLDMFVGKVKFTPPTRKRRRSLGISNGRSPKSTDVALPEAQPVCNR